MSRTRRKWTEAEKVLIIEEAQHHGVAETLRRHNVAQSLFHRWRRAYNGEGMEGLKPRCRTVDPEVRQIQQENERLKRIIANQALEFKT